MFSFNSPSVDFVPARDIPSLDGKVILVTGGNSGLGAESIKQLAFHNPARIYLCARTRSNAESTVQAIQSSLPNDSQDVGAIEVLELDLGDFDSVKKCADEFLQREKRLDVLLLNAGVAMEQPALTKSGYELQFGINHMGHALLSKLLVPILLRTAEDPSADVRTVSVASYGHHHAPREGILFNDLKTTIPNAYTLTRYGQSKLANILFIHSLATHYPPSASPPRNLTCLSVHPGAVATSISRDMRTRYPWFTAAFGVLLKAVGYLVDVSEGAKNQLWACTAEELRGRGGGCYFEPVGRVGKESEMARDGELAERLWMWTEGELRDRGFGGWP